MPFSNVNQLGPITSYVRYKDWVNTPGYRKKVVQGVILPENNFTTYSNETRSPRVLVYPNWPADPLYTDNLTFQERYSASSWLDARAVLNNNGYFRTPNVASSQDPWQTFVNTRAQLEILAGNKLSKKLNNRDIDLGVALGEARETAHFIQGAMLSAFVAAKRARRGDLSGVLKALGLSGNTDPKLQRFRDIPDKVSGAWLGFSYGVRPLLADVYGACKALEKRHERPTLLTYRASQLCELSIGLLSSNHTRSPPQGDFDPDYKMSIKGWHKASDKISFEISNPFLYTLSSLGLTNPLAVAWELTTLSFVVDWFIPIGAWINGLVPPQGVSSVRRSVTWRGDVYYDGGLVWRNGPKGRQFQPVYSHNKWKYRSVKGSFPRYHLVGATFDLSRDQVMSGLSLLWAFGSGRKTEARAYSDAMVARERAGVRALDRTSKEVWPEYGHL